MEQLIALESKAWFKDFSFIKENDDNDVERESLEGQIKMAINNVTATQLKFRPHPWYLLIN
jgi:hypothetical protein